MKRPFKFGQLLRPSLAVVAIAWFAAPTNADVWLTYSITIDTPNNVTNLLLSEQSPNLHSLAGSYTAFGFQTTEIRTLYADHEVPVESMLLGLVSDLPDDPISGLTHLVLMMSDEAAALSTGVEWSTLFPNTDEAALIDAILKFNSPDFDESVAASNFIFDFIRGDFAAGVIDPNTLQVVPFVFAPGDTFSVMAFSTGQQIGSGVSTVTRISAVPEPASAFLILAGLGCLGAMKWSGARR